MRHRRLERRELRELIRLILLILRRGTGQARHLSWRREPNEVYVAAAARARAWTS